MRILIALVLGSFIAGCGPRIEERDVIYHSVNSDQWGLCKESCGEAELSEVSMGKDWVKCSCGDLTEIRIDLPVETTTIEKK